MIYDLVALLVRLVATVCQRYSLKYVRGAFPETKS
jgi:hypothetical protein